MQSKNYKDWERKYASNETEKQFEPLEDTLVKIKLLKVSNSNTKREAKLLEKTKSIDEKNNRAHKWKEIKEGDLVHLTKSRIKGYPNEQPTKVFEKQSVQLNAEWGTDATYSVEKIHDTTLNRYELRNVESGKKRRTLYYREELLKINNKRKIK